MDPVSSIRRLGFRKWYERELIKGHAALVTLFLCGLLVAALMEQLNLRNFGWHSIPPLGVMMASGAIGCISWRSYITILERAERYGERSSCPKCDTYGRFKVLSTGLDDNGPAARAVAPLEAAWMQVECRKCAATWRMPD